MKSLDQDDRSFLQRFGFVIGTLTVGATAFGAVASQVIGGNNRPAPRPEQVTMVHVLTPLPPPPPPPPAPPPPPMAQEQKMIEQIPLDADDVKPDQAPPPADTSIGTNITGDGPPDAFGLRGNTGGRSGTGDFRGGNRGSRWGWYASEVQTAIADALRKNTATRDANFVVEARIWADATGRITSARLAGSTGDAKTDAALEHEILVGLQLQEAPPADMPLPIVMRLTARRPE